MIVPMKKVSLIVMSDKKKEVLKKLRRLGLIHIEITEGSGNRLSELNEQISLLENAIFAVSENIKKNIELKDVSAVEAFNTAEKILTLIEKKKTVHSQISILQAELDRIKSWGEINLDDLSLLSEKGIEFFFYEMPKKEYLMLNNNIKTLVLKSFKATVRFAVVQTDSNINEETAENLDMLEIYRFNLPKISTDEIRYKLCEYEKQLLSIEEELLNYAGYSQSMKNAVITFQKEIEFETYATGMKEEEINDNVKKSISISHFSGYIQEEDLEKLKTTAKDNSWGLLIKDPTPDDDVPTKLKNNKFVSLIYPLTDFIGTVPGYFEYDISGWFLGFILVFFGIIFGDGGYGLLICSAAGALIINALRKKQSVQPAYLLIALLGGATVLWGLLTCTWFGIAAEQLPVWLQKISLPVISNVYADKIWYPFWTQGTAGLTTAQNVQIFCFTLALVQLTIAHIKGALRNRKSLKILGDIGSALQVIGMFYVVLTLVVNKEVFGLGRVISGIPVGTISVVMIAIGFIMSFVFSNYEGSVVKSILNSLTNIVSILLGVVNIFSDIVSYIRLWAVGLAGAAISATVNELAGPLFGNFVFIIFAIVLLVFGHGLNMILNILSVIVHGIRLNTLEFSSHLDMSWSGHKFKPFEE